MNERQLWYREDYLLSSHWKETRKKAFEKHKRCQICKTASQALDCHHISYERCGMPSEHRDIRIVCRTHHKECHYVLWIFPLPKTPFYLTMRYYFVKIRYIILKRILLDKITKPMIIYRVWNKTKQQRFSHKWEEEQTLKSMVKSI